MIMKKKCALYASKLVKDGMVVGLGGGSTIQYLIDYVRDKDIQVVTPSAKTCLLYTSPSPRDRSLSRMPSSA